MDEINLKELFRYILSKIYIVILVLVLTVSVGTVYAASIKTPLYNSTTKLVLTSSGQSTDTAVTANDVTLSNNLVKTYAEIVKSQSVLAKVVDNLKLSKSASELAGAITVNSTTNTQIITVTVSDDNAERAQKIADEIAKVFKAEIVSLYKIDNVQIVDKAQAASAPYNINMVKSLLQYFAAGAALGLGVVLVMFYLDTTIKNSKMIEDKTGLVVLGVVPSVKNISGRK